MRYVRPFLYTDAAPGSYGPWLIPPDEDAGVTARVRRGNGTALDTDATVERFLLLTEGSVEVVLAGGGLRATTPEVVFLPAGQAAAVTAAPEASWIEVEATPVGEASGQSGRVIEIDESKFLGTGFAYQALIDRVGGATALRMNLMQVQPGAGSPDFHIHAFSQIYVIESGEMTVDVGKGRYKATAPALVMLPPGAVHRNFNASGDMERHISLLVPEPQPGDIFDFAITIEEREAEIMTSLPADAL